MTLTLKHGAHSSRDAGMCAMEAAAYVAGEPHGDHPKCVSPVIAAFCRSWNDALPSDDDRTRLLGPLVGTIDAPGPIIGTRTTAADDETRAWLATDWLVRVHTPAWLDLTPSLAEHAAKMRNLAPLVDSATEQQARPVTDAAGAAAWAAAGAAAWDALAPTVATLQQSSVDLVVQMCAVGRATRQGEDEPQGATT